eukprot:g53568.t1
MEHHTHPREHASSTRDRIVRNQPMVNPILKELYGVELKDHIQGLPQGVSCNEGILDYLRVSKIKALFKRMAQHPDKVAEQAEACRALARFATSLEALGISEADIQSLLCALATLASSPEKAELQAELQHGCQALLAFGAGQHPRLLAWVRHMMGDPTKAGTLQQSELEPLLPVFCPVAAAGDNLVSVPAT